jgi:CBS domain-containing membrane protein
LQIFRSFGPAVGHVHTSEALRAGLGAVVGLGLTGLLLLSPSIDLEWGRYLVAPFGATSVLLFAVPNSPLAQPWSAVIGNTVAALVAVAVCLLVSDPLTRVVVSVGLAISVTMMCRALHPPAGAVAMTAALSPDAIQSLGFWFAIMPIGLGTAALVAVAMCFARLTGRRYPFRQFEDPGPQGTEDASPIERLGLTESELSSILERYRQSFNLGVEDLARLIGAAEIQAATHETGPLTAAQIMSTDLVTVAPGTELVEVADLFRRHKFTSLPVIDQSGKYLGVIFQIHLIGKAREDALRLDRRFVSAFRRLLDSRRDRPVQAKDIMSVAGPRATTNTPISALLPMMADGDVDAVPVIEHGAITGIVTRTDLIAALARSVVRKT